MICGCACVPLCVGSVSCSSVANQVVKSACTTHVLFLYPVRMIFTHAMKRHTESGATVGRDVWPELM